MTARAKIFMHGRSQAVRLPKEFRMPGKEVNVRRVGRGVLLEPVEKRMTREEIEAVFQRIDSIGGDFMPEGRNQPPMPEDDPVFE
jgi:antitoxin VapB